jgi:hypothetical protein
MDQMYTTSEHTHGRLGASNRYVSACLIDDAPEPAGAGWRSVGLSNACQEERFWCWAAIGEAVDRHYGGQSWPQCRIAAAVLGESNCCGPDRPRSCDRRQKLSTALSTVGRYGRMVMGALDPVALRAEIDAGRPVAAAIRWRSDGGFHFVLCIGYDSAAESVLIEDPDRGRVMLDYPMFLGAYALDGEWTHSYLTRP